MAEHAIVKTYRGPKGGVWLARPPRQINLIDVIKAIEGEDVLGEYLLDDADHENYKLCELHKRWQESKEFINKKLWQANLKELLERY